MTQTSFTVAGVKLLDPRTNTQVASANPALILLDIAKRQGCEVDARMTQLFAEAADFCDANALVYSGIPSSARDVLAGIRSPS